ncbi:MAG: hypothetical protein DWQ44_02980 [Bacteroidetes bacterium]|nr:MAG: hypothetical protein DWQ33_04820 [Bacteroidota bacterium]REK00031.1 MAG: hypothetical protein DWQ39_14090 [Bacteroidota bacterium]REK35788.1 MAG: hypothetical protein DWQ44_02980 [Bacteroidota bacterium]REK49339.1 MAG: hypothetical protein DWQ48_07870 [Bacteroidota bacterium]
MIKSLIRELLITDITAINIFIHTFFLDKKSMQKNQDQLILPAAQADASRAIGQAHAPLDSTSIL